MTTAIAPISPNAITARDDRDAFEPQNFEQALRLAEHLAKSGLMPRALSSPPAIVTAVIMGRELGLSAMQSVRSIHVIEGKPALSSALIVALVKKRPDVCLYFRLVQSTDKIATYETQRVGDPEATRLSFSWEEAARAGVIGKDNWKKYPAAMLRARCETALARAVYPDLVMGLYDPDELEPVRTVAAHRAAPVDTSSVLDDEPPAPPAPVVPPPDPLDAEARAKTAEGVKALRAWLAALVKSNPDGFTRLKPIMAELGDMAKAADVKFEPPEASASDALDDEPPESERQQGDGIDLPPAKDSV